MYTQSSNLHPLEHDVDTNNLLKIQIDQIQHGSGLVKLPLPQKFHMQQVSQRTSNQNKFTI